MGRVCSVCGGKGYVWTGAERVLCRGCAGDGRAKPREQWLPRETPRVPDPIRNPEAFR